MRKSQSLSNIDKITIDYNLIETKNKKQKFNTHTVTAEVHANEEGNHNIKRSQSAPNLTSMCCESKSTKIKNNNVHFLKPTSKKQSHSNNPDTIETLQPLPHDINSTKSNTINPETKNKYKPVIPSNEFNTINHNSNPNEKTKCERISSIAIGILTIPIVYPLLSIIYSCIDSLCLVIQSSISLIVKLINSLADKLNIDIPMNSPNASVCQESLFIACCVLLYFVGLPIMCAFTIAALPIAVALSSVWGLCYGILTLPKTIQNIACKNEGYLQQLNKLMETIDQCFCLNKDDMQPWYLLIASSLLCLLTISIVPCIL